MTEQSFAVAATDRCALSQEENETDRRASIDIHLKDYPAGDRMFESEHDLHGALSQC